MTNKPKHIGTAAETAVVGWAAANGFNQAERRALHGSHDQGDILLCLGVIIEVKAGKKAETAADALIDMWLDQTETERLNAQADIGVLVTKRAGYGTSRVGDWWAWLTIGAFTALSSGGQWAGPIILDNGTQAAGFDCYDQPARLRLKDLAMLLRLNGWGNPITTQERNQQPCTD